MRVTRLAALALASLVGVSALSACSSSNSGSGSDKNVTLTYWASNQGTSLDNDKQVLGPELAKFTKQTGIKVKLQVVPWADLLNNILTATTSGKGPDVLNIGNTWSASLQATGAFVPFDDSVMAKIGGKSRFLGGSLSATGAADKPPTAVPIYSLAYGLYYNKKYFAEAGISQPPTTWAEFETDAKKVTNAQHWGLSIEGGSVSENVHNVFTLSQQQGGAFFDAAGKPTFDTPQNVAAVRQYLDFIQQDKITNPSNAEYAQGTEALADFAKGKSAMVLWQAASGSLKQLGMNAADIGVAPMPLPDPMPAGGKKVTSMVAGINLAVFKNTKHMDAALQFVKFMTSTPEQKVLNKTYGSMPSVTDAYADPAFNTPAVQTFKKILSTSAAPLPAVAAESQFETLIGTAVKNMLADAASGKNVSDSDISAQLKAAQQQLS
ncbi:MAG: multiple sugar transport system substrate-binding protein [Pseudonocardiales bacterium]|jgi:multiple sugar transport system substrate-binding protein|nr:multiple sugar transport system substrate-binding protein [Pseudonocardiales bacterium]MDT4963340.1 multiple sugar transport system substrate-binding protein [Pseudonocardiales bacterium]MDT4971827.1 multiple sugar transport system substrate-binding protein [Pseudonocardiales bacterium]